MSCQNPFDTLYLLPNGYTTCCQSWLSPTVPFFDDQRLSPWEVWNHRHFVQLRRRVLKQNWSTCQTCPLFLNKKVPQEITEDCKPVMKRGPHRIILTNDLSCNLECWSCRKGFIGRNMKTEERRERRMFEILDTFRSDILVIQLLQSGEVFSSPMHVKWLKGFNSEDWNDNLSIELTTNGTLLARKWDGIANCHANIKRIAISVDAASKQTYEQVRKGGKWEDLCEGLHLAEQLRLQESIDSYHLTFVVQAENFREIPEFIDMAERLRATCGFIPLLPWWQTKEAVKSRCPSHPGHPDNKEYLRVLEDERLRKPHVNASQLIGLARDRQKAFL